MTAWMESLLASLCHLGNMKVSVPPCLRVLSTNAVRQCCPPMLSTNAVYQCWLPVLSTNAVYLCCLPMLSTCGGCLSFLTVHLLNVYKTTWHVWNTLSHALSHTFTSAVRAVMRCFHSTTLMRLHFSTLCTLLSLLQLSEIVAQSSHCTQQRRSNSVCLLR